jgi:hypothetical protein
MNGSALKIESRPSKGSLRITMMGQRRKLNFWENEVMAVVKAFKEQGGAPAVRGVVQALVGKEDTPMPSLILKGARDRMSVAQHQSIQEKVVSLTKNRTEVAKSVNWLEVAISWFGTQSAAAAALHVTPAYISKILRLKTGVRTIPYSHVERLSDLTGISMHLIGSVGKESAEKPKPSNR